MLGKRSLLHDFEWHDLPVDEVCVTSSHLSLSVSPYAESTQCYRRIRFTISAERVDFSVTGTVGRRDLLALEVSSFSIVAESDALLSGRLTLLPGSGALWTIEFSDASWQIIELSVEITAAQRQLIAYLVSRMRNDAKESDRRWQGASAIAQQYAISGQLLLARDWTADLVMDGAGDVWIIDTETGQNAKRASVAERTSSLFRGLHAYPELFPMLPDRPPAAATCTSCEGAGLPPVVFANPQLRNLLCVCAGAG
jgi:hypothetical protein